MTEIEESVEHLQDTAAEVTGLLQHIQQWRHQAKQELDAGELTQDTCEALSQKMIRLHKLTRSLDVNGHLVHQRMSDKLPEGMSEGQKPWPH